MRRIACIALVAAAAGCGEVTEQSPGPTDRFYFPTGMGVHAGKLVVASSNFDLRYDPDAGGSLIAVDPGVDPATLTGGLNVASFSGELVIADATACPALAARGLAADEALAIVPVRGVGSVYQVRVSAAGALACDGCATKVGTPSFADPFAVGLACDGEIARAYVGYLRSSFGQGWITQIDLTLDPSAEGAVRNREFGPGEFRGFAYDATRQRLWATQTVTGGAAALLFVDVGGGCEFDPTKATESARACAAGTTVPGAVPSGLEPRAIALATPADGRPPRAYVTTRIYDPVLSASAGGRVGDFGGRLLVADLVETLDGRVDLEIVDELDMGYGASDVVVLPPSPLRAGQRDVVAALAAESGMLLLHDDEKDVTVTIGPDDRGAPLIGHEAFGLAVDPAASATEIARLYVGSFEDDFVTPIDVPFANISAAAFVLTDDGPDPDLDPDILRIRGPSTGGTP